VSRIVRYFSFDPHDEERGTKRSAPKYSMSLRYSYEVAATASDPWAIKR
jgi:hypothetical protein